jgi:hypothetical protein
MNTKLLEIRDEGTMIPVLCVDMNPDWPSINSVEQQEHHEAQRYLLRRCGYPCDGRANIAITHLRASGDRCWNDPYGWGGRTYPVAHDYIIKHWDELRDGDVVDVQFILGETAAPKRSERVTVPL